jgi:uncharacterized membrane protein YgcG
MPAACRGHGLPAADPAASTLMSNTETHLDTHARAGVCVCFVYTKTDIVLYVDGAAQLNDQRMEAAVKNVLAKLYSERLGKVGPCVCVLGVCPCVHAVHRHVHACARGLMWLRMPPIPLSLSPSLPLSLSPSLPLHPLPLLSTKTEGRRGTGRGGDGGGGDGGRGGGGGGGSKTAIMSTGSRRSPILMSSRVQILKS